MRLRLFSSAAGGGSESVPTSPESYPPSLSSGAGAAVVSATSLWPPTSTGVTRPSLQQQHRAFAAGTASSSSPTSYQQLPSATSSSASFVGRMPFFLFKFAPFCENSNCADRALSPLGANPARSYHSSPGCEPASVTSAADPYASVSSQAHWTAVEALDPAVAANYVRCDLLMPTRSVLG